MPNAIPCKHCGKQCTDHHVNPQKFTVVPARTIKKGDVLDTIVCDRYDPDIVKGELPCTCTKDLSSCNGLCIFQSKNGSDVD